MRIWRGVVVLALAVELALVAGWGASMGVRLGVRWGKGMVSAWRGR